MADKNLSFLSPEAQAVIAKACSYCGLHLTVCPECDITPKQEEDTRINIASGEDAYAHA